MSLDKRMGFLYNKDASFFWKLSANQDRGAVFISTVREGPQPRRPDGKGQTAEAPHLHAAESGWTVRRRSAVSVICISEMLVESYRIVGWDLSLPL